MPSDRLDNRMTLMPTGCRDHLRHRRGVLGNACGRLTAMIASAAMLAVAGCGGEAPRQQVYSLDLTTAAPLPAPLLGGVVMVETFTADSVLGSRRIAWRESPSSQEIRTRTYHEWNEAPPRLLQSHLYSCLSSAGAADAVVLPTDRAEADYILGGDIRRFEQQITGPDSSTVEIAVDLRLAERRTRERLWREVVVASAPAADASPEAAVNAFAVALSSFCQAVLTALPRIGG